MIVKPLVLSKGKALQFCFLGLLVIAFSVLVSDGTVLCDPDGEQEQEQQPDPGVGTWKKINGLKVKRYHAAAEWIPKQKCVVVWGGTTKWPEQRELKSGQIYWPEKDEWTTIAIEGAPSQRIWSGHTTDGSKFIFWGGCKLDTFGGRYFFYSSGGIYDPKKNKWDFTSFGGPQKSMNPWLGCDGKKLYIYGGVAQYTNCYTVLNSGSVYNLSKHTWDPKMEISAEGESQAPKGRSEFAAVLYNKKMYVWGGHWPRSWPNPTEDYSWGDGGIWNPKGRKAKWEKISTENAPPAHFGMKTVLAEDLGLMLFYGGRSINAGRTTFYGTVNALDLKKNVWVTKPDQKPIINPRLSHGVVWTGKKMIIWGGVSLGPDEGGNLVAAQTNTGAIYDPVEDTWGPIALKDAPSPRSDFAMVWMDGKLLIAGGFGMSGKAKEARALGDCYVYTPPADALPEKEEKK